jgi:hypothetical protein
MADGRWYTRPVLRQRLPDLKYDAIKGWVVRLRQRGWIDRAAHPVNLQHRIGKGGVRRVPVTVFRINSAGRKALARIRSGRSMFADFMRRRFGKSAPSEPGAD